MIVGHVSSFEPAQRAANYLLVRTLLGLSPVGRDAGARTGLPRGVNFKKIEFFDGPAGRKKIRLESGRDGRGRDALVALTEAGQA